MKLPLCLTVILCVLHESSAGYRGGFLKETTTQAPTAAPEVSSERSSLEVGGGPPGLGVVKKVINYFKGDGDSKVAANAGVENGSEETVTEIQGSEAVTENATEYETELEPVVYEVEYEIDHEPVLYEDKYEIEHAPVVYEPVVYSTEDIQPHLVNTDYRDCDEGAERDADGLCRKTVRTHERGSIKVAPDSNLSDYTVLLRGVGDSLKDLTVFSKSGQTGTNACAINNGGCAELCLYNGTHPVCACAHGLVAEDGKTCKEYDSFLMYSRVVRIDSVHFSDEHNLSAPYPSIQSNELMHNAIGLTYDYSRSTLYYSDIQQGSINAVHFNGTNQRLIVQRQGSVEGLAHEALHNTLYWTCNNNNDATINKASLNAEKPVPEVIMKLGPSDKPRGIAVDSCDGRMYWTNWNSHHPCIQRAFLTGYGQQAIITTDIRLPNALTLDHRAQKLYWGDARLDKIERCEYDGTQRVILAKVTPQHPFDMAVHGDLLFWTDWVQHAVIRANKYTGADVVWLRKDVHRPMGIVAISNNYEDCKFAF